MSLTSFLKNNPDVRAKFLSQFKKPEFWLKAELKSPPLTQSYGLAGTAFDYLLRFYIEKLNPRVRTSRWVAEEGLALLEPGENGEDTLSKAKWLLAEAKSRHKRFLKSRRRRPTTDLIEAAVMLAYLDTIYRAGIVDANAFEPIPPAIVEDLQAMLRLVRPVYFLATNRCILNPTFGSASELVGGADADLIIDDTLIDVKTTKHFIFDREMFNQLVGYYVLACIDGIDNCPRGSIKYLAVYYARYGVLHRIRISDFVVTNQLPPFLRWFKRRARQEYSNRLLN